MLKKCIHSTPLSELLLDRGITYNKDKKKGYKLMLKRNGIELGYYSATEAHKKFILGQTTKK